MVHTKLRYFWCIDLGRGTQFDCCVYKLQRTIPTDCTFKLNKFKSNKTLSETWAGFWSSHSDSHEWKRNLNYRSCLGLLYLCIVIKRLHLPPCVLLRVRGGPSIRVFLFLICSSRVFLLFLFSLKCFQNGEVKNFKGMDQGLGSVWYMGSQMTKRWSRRGWQLKCSE